MKDDQKLIKIRLSIYFQNVDLDGAAKNKHFALWLIVNVLYVLPDSKFLFWNLFGSPLVQTQIKVWWLIPSASAIFIQETKPIFAGGFKITSIRSAKWSSRRHCRHQLKIVILYKKMFWQDSRILGNVKMICKNYVLYFYLQKLVTFRDFNEWKSTRKF